MKLEYIPKKLFLRYLRKRSIIDPYDAFLLIRGFPPKLGFFANFLFTYIVNLWKGAGERWPGNDACAMCNVQCAC